MKPTQSLRVTGLELYRFPFQTSRYRSFDEHIQSFDGAIDVIEPDALGAGMTGSTVAAVLRETSSEIAVAMSSDGDAAARQSLFERWIAALGLPLRDEIVGNVRPMLITILGAVAALLLIACANLASLSLARAAGRQRDLAVRAALGAARGQLVRLLFIESAVLAFVGSVIGFLLALWGSDILVRFVPADLPRANGVTIDVR